jgi:hypothetical protein
MMRKGIIYLVWVIVMLCSCKNETSKAQEVTQEFDPHRTANEAREMLTKYLADVAHRGLKAEFDYLDNSDSFWWHPPGFNGPIGYDSVATVLKEMSKDMLSITSRWTMLNVAALTDTTASYRGDVTSIQITKTKVRDTLYMHEEGMLIKRPDGWKLWYGTTVLKDKPH